ncbi:MAG: EF-hand domain-containing protein [Oscillatoria sp. PMC 1051.18]|nr:EF-hand domain-containing protein [Oscillatoria sp. PMC 1050.18]MEC5029619.1 EF-hand domain-containing protein [Oscillatoria sp. PMC 1051.18]
MALTELQQKKLKKMFDAYDYDSSKALTKSDFDAVIDHLSKQLGYSKGSQDYQKVESQFSGFWSSLHKEADLDEDANVTLEEWLAYFDKQLNDANFKSTGLSSGVDVIFSSLDKDGSGSISVEEYTAMLTAWKVSESEANAIFSKLDINGDGSLSKEEMKELYDQFYYSDDPEAPGNYVHGLV